MSSVKDSLLGAPADVYSDYRTVSKETAIVTVEPTAYKEAARDDWYTVDGDWPGAGCVSFHNVSYEVSSYFGRKRKVILNRVR
jgi:hypothetical protein